MSTPNPGVLAPDIAEPDAAGAGLTPLTTKSGKRLRIDARGHIKPLMRGTIHAVVAPLALASGIVLMVLAPTAVSRLALAIFTFCSVLLFGTSGAYHTGHWSLRTSRILRRVDHANIFLLIAGTYTPLSILLLPHNTARLILFIAWSGALLGLAFHMFWIRAPRWVFVPIYIAVGCVALGFLGPFWRFGGPWVVAMIIAGGAAYIGGAIIYALKRPRLSLRWFGFHELFHALTVVGFACHTIAIYLAVLAARA